MTRKKSNVKALALAVTCAILAGGGIGLEPVYAETPIYHDVVKYDSANRTLDYEFDDGAGTGTAAIQKINFGNIVLDGSSGAGTITATSLKLNGIGDVKTAIEGKAAQADVENNKNNIANLQTKTTKISYNATTGTTVEGAITATGNITANGGLSAANGRFTVKASGETVVKGANGKVTINNSGINIAQKELGTNKDLSITLDSGYVDASGYVKAPKFIIDNDNGFVKEADGKSRLTVSDVDETGAVTNSVKIGGGNILASGDVNVAGTLCTNTILNATHGEGVTVDGATGNTTVGGDLTVAGAASFAQETTFANGIKTDKINEKNDGKGVTVDGVLLKDGGITATGNVTTTGDIQGNNITATGVLKGQTLGIGTNGSKFTVDENGNAAVGGTLGVTGKTTLSDELQVDKTATFGSAKGAETVINGDEVKTGRIETTKTQSSYIGGVTLLNGQITADNMTITGTLDMDNLKVNEKLEVGTYGVTKAGVVTGVTSINDVAVSKQGNGLKIGSATVGDINPFSSQGYTVDATGNVSAQDITAGKYNGNEITADKKFNGVELNGGNVKATNITDGQGFTATGGNVTAKNIQADTGTIAGVTFAAGGSVSGINDLTATGTIKGSILKVDENNYLNSEGLQAKKAVIDSVVIDDASITTTGANGLNVENVKLDNGAITANSATIGGVNTLDNTGFTVQADKSISLGASKITDGKVEVSSKTSLANEALILNDTNKWTNEGGLVADKATVNGIALGTDSKGKAIFTDANDKITTIAGDKITTGTITADKLLIDKISLGKDGNDNISIDKNGDVTTKGDVTVTGDDNDTTVIDGAKATFGNDAANQTVIDKGKISAKAKAINDQQAGLKFDENGLTVSGQNAEGKTSSFSFNAETGASTFIDKDGTSTTINGSSVRSFNSATGAGHLNGATLNLWKDNDNSTYMTAGGVTFNGEAGEKGGKTTTINGGTITTDTLNVEHINLGGEMVDKNGTTFGSNLSMDAQGNFTAAGGNFNVTGGSGEDKGAMTNTVGNTTLQTGTTGASMSYDNGDVTSNISVGDNKANVSAGAGSIDVTNDSITNKVGANVSSTMTADSITDKVGGTVVETKDGSFKATGADGNGIAIDTNTGGATFTGKDYKDATVKGTTVINGNEIITGKITTDELVITGKGDAAGPGTGSLAFGGNGTIKSDVKEDGSTNNTQFTTDINGVNTKVTDGTTTTENNVSAAGNSNTVKQDDTHKSEFNQGLTSIGGVVTNGEIKVAQKLDGAAGKLTGEVTDANGSSKLVQNGTGLEYTDNTNADNATRINSSDVSIGSATEPDKRINLSDLGQIDELDKEIRDNEVYKSNETAVGGINAEAAIRRGEVERLDNRISEEVTRLDGRINDVNDRVNKVGAMAAAIASLKSIGYDPQAPSEFSIGLGQYKGETGVAMGFFHYPNKNFMINVSLSTAGGETMGGIGATWRFGHKSPQKLLEEQREEQAKKELAAAEKYQAAAKLAKEAQERAEYAAKLARQAQVSADNAKAAADATQAKHFG